VGVLAVASIAAAVSAPGRRADGDGGGDGDARDGGDGQDGGAEGGSSA